MKLPFLDSPYHKARLFALIGLGLFLLGVISIAKPYGWIFALIGIVTLSGAEGECPGCGKSLLRGRKVGTGYFSFAIRLWPERTCSNCGMQMDNPVK
jgi:hypothetical protein